MALLDADEFQRWRNQAAATRGAAEATQVGGSWAWCCFLAEQAAQFGAKGLLRAIGRPSQAWGHDLATLVARAGDAVGDPLAEVAVVDAAARLARHYIPARYPDAHASGTPAEHYRESDAAGALADLDAVLGAVDTVWDVLRRGEQAEERSDAAGEGGEAP